MKPIRIFLFFLLLLVVLSGGYALLPPMISLPWGGKITNPVRTYIEKTYRTSPHRILPVVNALQDSLVYSLRRPVRPAYSLSLPDSLIRSVPPLIYDKALEEKWRSLMNDYANLSTDNLTSHILYYGDSQIEGDRVTHQLRDSLQEWFGGGGPGLFLPVMTVPETYSLILNADPVWKKEACDLNHSTLSPFSATGIFLEHTSFIPDTTKPLPQKASFTVSWQSYASGNVRSADRYRLWFHGPRGKATLTTKTGNSIQTKKINTTSSLNLVSGVTGTIGKNITFTIETAQPFIVEAVSLEKSPGILVDNIPLRGRTMVYFSDADKDYLSSMMTTLNVHLVILQFGLNVIAGGTQEVSRFAGKLHKQLSLLRKIDPGVMVIIVGTTDMYRPTENRDSLSFKLRNIQRAAAQKEGCLFWDSFQAMGGYGSAGRWMDQDPPLMRPDVVHLSREGSQLLTSMFITALKQEIFPDPESAGTEIPHP